MPALDATVLTRLQEALASHPPLVLTGAGISTASGIPDYRDADGVRRGRQPMMFQEFVGAPAARQRYWARGMLGWRKVGAARPNPAHEALAALQAGGRIAGLITQNVDDLHNQAGSRDVIELHGNLHRVRCLACEWTMPREALQEELEANNGYLTEVEAVFAPDGDALLAERYLADFRTPLCPKCHSDLLKPDVVFFGENVARPTAAAAAAATEAAPALLVIGSSLMAFSAFRLCQATARAGKPLMALNLGRTRADDLVSLKLESHAEAVLPMLAEALR